ncbi:DUF2254 domain-containing protein [Egicoccus halophilus]|uniref:DUF2254 domain-containing protein n=1 Tax=Egicoccus halophilus TaxID=1670830 RepID=UPI0013EED064|nr:DUF2254 domain-containing protein [Egicoccus halophilus]
MPGLPVRVHGWWEDLQDSLWLLPAVGVVLSIALARILVALEPEGGGVPDAIAFTGNAAGAHEVLGQLTGATFTVMGVVFSLTIVALQMASSQFSPRLLRTFLKDRSVQLVLTGLVGSGVFHVSVLRHVRSPEEGEAFVPELATTFALLYALVAVGLVVYFLHHLSSQLRVEVIMASIRRETLGHLRELAADRGDLPDAPPPEPPATAGVVRARTGGYLQTVDAAALVAVAERHGVVVRLRPLPGSWVAKGTTLAWVWGVDGRPPSADDDRLAPDLHGALHLGPERTETGDIAFGIRQLEDIAGRALSTGVNDPTTAAQAVGQIGAVLIVLADHPLGADLGHDDQGRIRVAAPRPTFADHLELAVGQVRRYGATEPAVLLAVLQALTDVAERVADHGDRAADVRDQVRRTVALADLDDPADEQRVRTCADVALRTLDEGRRPPTVQSEV